MPNRNSVSWKQFEKFVLFVGCKFDRERGDHRVYWRNDLKRPVIFSRDKSIPLFVIRNNLRILGMSWKELEEILQKI